ncbi:MAG: hypothetical protein ACKOI0_03500 [Actinomycetota bacterium]
MKAVRVIALGLVGLLAAAAIAMGTLRLVRVDLDEPSDVDAFPALAPVSPSTSTPATPTPTAVTPTEDATPATATPSRSPSPDASPSARASGEDDHHEGSGDDD